MQVAMALTGLCIGHSLARMKVSEVSPDRLIIDDIPWVRGTLIILVTLFVVFAGFRELNAGRALGHTIVVGAVVVGGLFFALFVERYQILFLRAEGVVLRRKRSVFGYKEQRYALAQVSHAEVEEKSDSDGARMYQPVLILPDQETPRVPLVDYTTNALDIAGVVEAINDWLGVPQHG